MKRIFFTLAAVCLSLGVGAQQLSPDSISMYDEIQKIEVVATRATQSTPVAFTNIKKEEIAVIGDSFNDISIPKFPHPGHHAISSLLLRNTAENLKTTYFQNTPTPYITFFMSSISMVKLLIFQHLSIKKWLTSQTIDGKNF